MTYEREMKAIKLVQERGETIGNAHAGIATDLEELKRQLLQLDGAAEAMQGDEFTQRKAQIIETMTGGGEMARTELTIIYAEAEARYIEPVGLADILSFEDFAEAERRVDRHVLDFNRRYGLDGWDYAIAGSCGLFAAMLDLLCVRAPLETKTAFDQKVDGIFNQAVQVVFNKLIPPELSTALSDAYKIGAPDSSSMDDLIDAPAKALRPMNHRLRSLAHDPLLGFIFGVLDMMNGTCTIVVNGTIQSIPSKKGVTDGSVFQLLGRMLGHLLSDVNAPSPNPKGDHRGMGLPAPFMGLLRMLEFIPVPTEPTKANPTGWSDFGKQIEWMYVNGYDFRQFAATSVPMAIMEVLLRAFYVAKQMKLYGAAFGETVLDTMPGRLNPRFRTVLALAYGTSSAVNAGKMYVTKNILNASYASWMGLSWNGFHALKWALYEKHTQLWGEVEAQEIAELERLVDEMDALEARAANLPV
jgi:hypothetical protein